MNNENDTSHHILVTGGSGFIGHHLVKQLSSSYHVTVIDLVAPNSPVKDVDYIQADISELSGEDIGPTVDGIIHLAAISRVITAEYHALPTWTTNVEGTQHLLSLLYSREKKPWFIYGSSREVYGEPISFPVTESHPLLPMNRYAQSKLAAEHLVSLYSNSCAVPSMILRFSNVYGDINDQLDRVIPKFILQALDGEDLELQGATNTFDFTHISDTVQGILLAIQSLTTRSDSSCRRYNICTGQGTTLRKLADLTIELTNSSSRTIETSSRTFDVGSYWGDFLRAKTELGYSPTIPLREGLSGLVAKFQTIEIEEVTL